KREAEVAESLGAHGGMSRNEAALAKDKAVELETRYSVEQQRLALMTETIDSQLAVQRSQVDRLRAVAEFQQNVLRALLGRGGAARLERGWDDRDRAARAGSLYGPARVRPAEQHDRDVQDHGGRSLRHACTGAGGPQLGQHDRGHAWSQRARLGDPVGHVAVG